jgi:hypothetical protein
MPIRPTIAPLNITATSYWSRRGFYRFRRRPALILRRSVIRLLFPYCSFIKAARLGRLPGKQPVVRVQWEALILSLLKLRNFLQETIYFQTTEFHKRTATAESCRMESLMEPNYLINELCCFWLALVYFFSSLFLLLLSVLQQCAGCTPIHNEQ